MTAMGNCGGRLQRAGKFFSLPDFMGAGFPETWKYLLQILGGYFKIKHRNKEDYGNGFSISCYG